jgi:hypothetical protein
VKKPVNARNIGNLWTLEECNQLRDEVRAGRGLQDIATIHGRTVYGIISKMVSLNMLVERGWKYYLVKDEKPWVTSEEVKKMYEGNDD